MGAFEPTGLVKPLRTAVGAVTLWFPAGDLVAARVAGHVDAGLAAAAYAEVDRYAQAHEHPGRGFVDLTALTTFEWEARLTLMRWNVAHRYKASRMDVLTDSWIVHLSLGALGTILGDRLVAHQSRAAFETAYASSLARRTTGRSRATA
jgi:hypothetical protein